MPFHSPDDDRFHEECGLFGIFGHDEAAALTALGLHALQHRGQEAAGIVSYDGEHFHTHRALGLVGDTFSSENVIGKLGGNMSIGHVRYSTTGETLLRNVQPLFADFKFGGLAVAHNGNLTNAHTMHKALVERGCIFQSTSDTETIIHLIAISQFNKVVDRITDAMMQMDGAYSLVALTRHKLIGVRDPHGVRPLVLGQLGKAWILTSETCALDIIGAEFVREVDPGEIVVIDEKGVQSLKPFQPAPRRFCIFEHIYFARPDSVMDGQAVYDARKRIGAELAKESDVDGRYRRPGSGFRCTQRHRICRGIRHAVRSRHHPESLCRTDLHRTDGADPQPWRPPETQCQCSGDPGQESGARRRFDRSRHHPPSRSST